MPTKLRHLRKLRDFFLLTFRNFGALKLLNIAYLINRDAIDLFFFHIPRTELLAQFIFNSLFFYIGEKETRDRAKLRLHSVNNKDKMAAFR